MVEKLEGNAQLLLTPEESELFVRQAEAQRTADTPKEDADYQNEPHDGEQCSGCSMFVPGFDGAPGGFCTKVESYNGPLGLIFADGWCKFFQSAQEDADFRAEYEANAGTSGEEAPDE